MIESLTIVQGIIERGLIFSLVVAAVYFSSRLIKFDNLAIEGAFGFGGAVNAFLINFGINPWIGLVGSSIAGALSGLATGLLTTHVKLNSLLSGIVITTGLFSIILKIAGSNMALRNSTVFTCMPSWFAPYQSLVLLTIISTALFLIIAWFLTTEIGILLHTVGDNPQMLTNIGKSSANYKILGLAISNILAALSGALFVQYTGYFSIWSNVGVLIIGIAGMILAQIVTLNFGLALVLGSCLYQAIIALTFELQLDQDWNKLITALLIVFLIALKQKNRK